MNAINMKVGLGFVAVAVLLGATQTQLLDALLVFAAAGVIPGTNVSLSPEATFYMLAGWLMLGIGLLFRGRILRARDNVELELLIQEHVSATSERTETIEPKPRLRYRFVSFWRLAWSKMSDVAMDLYAELKTFREPLVAQAITARRELVQVVVRTDWRSTARFTLRESIETIERVYLEWMQAFSLWLVQVCVQLDRWLFK